MTKPPSKPEPAPPAKPSRAKTSVVRPKPSSLKATMLDQLLENPHAFHDDEVKVWVRSELPEHPEKFHKSLTEYVDSEEGSIAPCEVMEVSKGAPLQAGQHFLHFRVRGPADVLVEICQVRVREPILVFHDVVFNLYFTHSDYCGVKLGSPWPFVAAAKRALKDTAGKDWFGGIAEFSSKYLRPTPVRPNQR